MEKVLYERIRSRRKELKMSQSELAKLLGYSDKSMISKIENGKVDLPESRIVQFANALLTSPEYLIGWLDDPYEDYEERLDEIYYDVRSNEILRAYWESDIRIQNAICALLNIKPEEDVK